MNSSSQPQPGARGTRGRRLRRLLLRVAGTALATCLLAEILVRGVLFGGWLADRPALAVLRSPASYTLPNEDAYYELRHALWPAERSEPFFPDPLLGWVSRWIAPDTYAHLLEDDGDPRRPVLLFGDSYAACNVLAPADGFPALFAGSDLGAGMRLVNYGVAGYGWDQICVLAERAVPRWVGRRPVVVMSLMVDDDLDRCRLSIRNWPKLRLRPTAEGGLEPERYPLPTTAEHVRRAMARPRSWAWRLLTHSGVLPRGLAGRLRGTAAAEGRSRELARRLTERAVARLRELDVDFGFLLFHDFPSVSAPERLGWRERVVVEVLEEQGVPYALTRQRLAEHLAEAARQGIRPPESACYLLEGPSGHHLNAAGNRVALEDLVELVRRIDGPE